MPAKRPAEGRPTGRSNAIAALTKTLKVEGVQLRPAVTSPTKVMRDADIPSNNVLGAGHKAPTTADLMDAALALASEQYWGKRSHAKTFRAIAPYAQKATKSSDLKERRTLLADAVRVGSEQAIDDMASSKGWLLSHAQRAAAATLPGPRIRRVPSIPDPLNQLYEGLLRDTGFCFKSAEHELLFKAQVAGLSEGYALMTATRTGRRQIHAPFTHPVTGASESWTGFAVAVWTLLDQAIDNIRDRSDSTIGEYVRDLAEDGQDDEAD